MIKYLVWTLLRCDNSDFKYQAILAGTDVQAAAMGPTCSPWAVLLDLAEQMGIK